MDELQLAVSRHDTGKAGRAFEIINRINGFHGLAVLVADINRPTIDVCTGFVFGLFGEGSK